MNKNICRFLLSRIRTVPGKTVRYKSANIPCNLLSNHSLHLCNGKSLQQHAAGLHLDLPNLLKWNDTVGGHGRRRHSSEPSPSVETSSSANRIQDARRRTSKHARYCRMWSDSVSTLSACHCHGHFWGQTDDDIGPLLVALEFLPSRSTNELN